MASGVDERENYRGRIKSIVANRKYFGTFGRFALRTRDQMKIYAHFLLGFTFLSMACASLHAQPAAPLTNTVTASSLSAYTVNGQLNPSFTLMRGVTYVFQVNASIHPFYIKTVFTNGLGVDAYTSGVTGSGTTGGNLIFTVPMNAPDVLYYHCGNHFPMGAVLSIVNPPLPPPAVKIVFVSISDTGVMMQSVGASNWTAIPEYNSNLTLNAWTTVPNFTNTFLNGTNTTTFDRLDPICGPNVFLRMRNQSQ